MRCSWCEPLLDEYVDGALDPARTAAVTVHLRACPACDTMHLRMRVVDGLLMTARAPALRDDFTERVMSAARLLPAPAPLRKPLLPLAAFYLVAAWIVTAATLALLRPTLPLGALAGAAQSAARAVAQGSHALWPIAPFALPAIVSVLVIDVLLFAAVAVFYRRVRPRLTAYLAAPVEAA